MKCDARCFRQSMQKTSRLRSTIYLYSTLRPTRESVPYFQKPATHLQQSCSSAANLSGRYYSKLSFLLFFQHSCNTYYWPFSTILKAIASVQGKFVGQLYEKRLAHLAHCPESQVVLKTSNKKNCILPPMSASRCSATYNCFRSSLRILFTAFSETKTQL